MASSQACVLLIASPHLDTAGRRVLTAESAKQSVMPRNFSAAAGQCMVPEISPGTGRVMNALYDPVTTYRLNSALWQVPGSSVQRRAGGNTPISIQGKP